MNIKKEVNQDKWNRTYNAGNELHAIEVSIGKVT